MKIALAYSPFNNNDAVLVKAQALIKILKPESIEVVYVASPSESALSLAFDVPAKIRFSEYPKTEIAKKLTKAGFKYDRITVLNVDSVSMSQQALELSKFLKRKKFDFTIIATHARKGLDRFFQGSFAESMLLNHQSPLLVFNPRSKIPKSISKILFGSDLSKVAGKNLATTYKIAKKLKSIIDVLYISEAVYKGIDTTGMLYAQAYQGIYEGRKAQLEAQIKKVDPKMNYIIDSSWAAMSEIFLKQAQKNKTDLIVMNSKINPLIAALGGSVTRQVIRASELPVLVLVG